MEEKEKLWTYWSYAAIWLGAGVSIAEILTGTLFAPLGFVSGIKAILSGHLIGCVMLFLTGMIGAKAHKSAMESVRMSFGSIGKNIFLALNVMQLVGWTAVMISSGARAAAAVSHISFATWAVLLACLIMFWTVAGVKNIEKMNTVIIITLFALTLMLAFTVFSSDAVSALSDAEISFGTAMELSAAMPLSWLPLISDYTMHAKRPAAASAVCTVSYFISSTWMYVIGMSAAIFTGENEIAAIMLKAGFGLLALFIIIASTVTTTFLDAYSTGVCCVPSGDRIREKCAGITCVAAGVVIALCVPVERFEDFLCLISSVFAPMCAVQLTDFFLLKRDISHRKFDTVNFVVWLGGFIAYRYFLTAETPIGSTVPAMLVTALLRAAAGILLRQPLR